MIWPIVSTHPYPVQFTHIKRALMLDTWKSWAEAAILLYLLNMKGAMHVFLFLMSETNVHNMYTHSYNKYATRTQFHLLSLLG